MTDPIREFALGDEEIMEAVTESYEMVVARLPRKRRPRGWGL